MTGEERSYHGSVKLMTKYLLDMTVSLVALALVVSGCQSSGKPAVSAEKQYPVRAVVVSTDAAKGEVTLNAETIPGFMEAMTMPYKLKDPSVISELHPGDKITATLTAQQDAAGPVNMKLDQIVVIAQARPDNVPKIQYHVPAPGDAVPDYPMLNQSGRKIKLSQFRGKVVLLTFVYTRCAMADFCLKMTHNFAEIDKSLAADPKLYAGTHLLSISFDPTYDSPQVLRSYGGAYTGKYSKEMFGHWDFVAPSVQDLPKMEQFFDLGVTGQGTDMMHSLATVVVGKDGKVVAYYPSNDWTTDAVLKDIRAAA
jgi:protein SCO1/2